VSTRLAKKLKMRKGGRRFDGRRKAGRERELQGEEKGNNPGGGERGSNLVSWYAKPAGELRARRALVEGKKGEAEG